MQTKTKLLISYGVIILLMLVPGAAYRALNRITDHEILQIMQGALMESHHASDMMKGLFTAHSAVQEITQENILSVLLHEPPDDSEEPGQADRYLGQGLESFRLAHSGSVAATSQSINLARIYGQTKVEASEKQEDLRSLANIAKDFSAYTVMAGEIRNRAQTDPLSATRHLENRLTPLFRTRILPEVENYRKDSLEELEESLKNVRNNIHRAKRMTETFFVTAVLVSGIFGLLITGSITRSVLALGNGAKAYARGDFDAGIDIGSGGEFGKLADVMRNMAAQLKERSRELDSAKKAIEAQNQRLENRVWEQTLHLKQINSRLLQEIEERKAAESRIRKALEEKKILLKEIHHRVKNNLQVISSLLYLQSGRLSHPEAVGALMDSRDRIQSMAFIHEKLYQSRDLSRIHMADYTESLIGHLRVSAMDRGGGVRIEKMARAFYLPIEIALPLGQIMNELITNALKHAFTGRHSGVVTVELSAASGSVDLAVVDDGNGMPPNVDLKNPQRLGFQLVTQLAEQIGARLLVEQRETGACIRMRIPRPDPAGDGLSQAETGMEGSEAGG